ncbi:hypothetical protein [Methylomonas fluvii]|uniref:Cytochrome c n=1 Tax=Methylomonas fluvii TaxID=1854564 RepID=A0ABR9DKV3_9GAMM|nr:hypothetical protein [Methylomonas fluvii]MBD9363735.1 hypothetical protein [Methylomonas fluvii]
MNLSRLAATMLIGSTSLLLACADLHHHEHEQQQNAFFTPGLGEIMAQTAARHTKLWFAGQERNWELAAYEIDELHEGFADAGKYHPTHKEIKQPIPELIARYMDKPLAGIEQAIKDKNLQGFIDNYNGLTAACNTCHQSTAFGFNVVVQPNFNPFANQAFGSGN